MFTLKRRTTAQRQGTITLPTDGYDRARLASDTGAPAALLDELSQDSSVTVRREVGGNPSTRSDTLDRLAGDSDTGVRQEVAWNPSTLPSTLARLAGDDDADVRYVAAQNPATVREVPSAA